MAFAHLHVHSEYSPIDSLARVKDLVSAAAVDGNPALAVTDHGTLGGIWKLGQHARAAGLKPIPGIEAYLAIGSRHEKNAIDVPADEDGPAGPSAGDQGATRSKKYEHLTILATSSQGWRNLVAMTNEAQRSYWYKPRIDYDLLAEHAGGLVVLTGCIGGPVAGPLSRGEVTTARDNLERLVDAVGKSNVYVEVMDHDIPGQHTAIDGLRDLATEFDLPLVATNDAHFIHEDQADAHDAWLAVGTQAKLTDHKRFRIHGHGHHLRTEAEMRALRDEDWWQDACDNTMLIADRVAHDVLPEPSLRLPRFPIPEGYITSSAYLKHVVGQGARRRYLPPKDLDKATSTTPLPDNVKERLEFEFGVIDAMGLADYFLITWDMIGWARSDRGLPTAGHPDGEPGKKQPIRVGPGRGSAAGACLSYCLHIVNLDPIEHGLLFERFLDPTRVGMPDIDTDVEQGRRGEVLAYLQARYGRDKVARLGTFAVARTRAAIKDAARVLDARSLGDKLSPLVPAVGDGKVEGFAGLDDTSNQSTAAFRDAVRAAGKDGQRIVELARSFENVTKLEGIHACGTLIADEPLVSLVPLRPDRGKSAGPDALQITSWDGRDVDDYGLLKMDVLGLRTLDLISSAERNVETSTGERITIESVTPGDGSARDVRTWELITTGRTASVFQLESQGMTRLAEAVRPSSLADLTALVALYRPGPMGIGAHERYADRKNGREPVDYTYLTTERTESDAIASVLGETYGLPVYQEQLMRLGSVVGGLDAGMRNVLRKAFSKKDAAKMQQVKDVMFPGALAGRGESGVVFAQATLERLWALFEASAQYLFNKSHSATYGYIAYQTAYLKANWPVEYAAAVLSTTDGDEKRLAILTDLQREGIEVKAPDINRSGLSTGHDGGTVLIGLGEVKGVGDDAAAIIEEREENGPFTSVADVAARVRVKGKALRINLIEALVEAGAFDQFGPRFGHLMITRAIKAHPEITVPDAEWGILEKSLRQRARLGLSTGEHPLVVLRDDVVAAVDKVRPAGQPLTSAQLVGSTPDGAVVLVVGVLSGWTSRSYAKGRMANVTVEGTSGSVSGVMWNGAMSQLEEAPGIGSVVLLRGKVRVRATDTETISEDGSVVVDTVEQRDLMIWDLHTLDVTASAEMNLAGPELAWRTPRADEPAARYLDDRGSLETTASTAGAADILPATSTSGSPGDWIEPPGVLPAARSDDTGVDGRTPDSEEPPDRAERSVRQPVLELVPDTGTRAGAPTEVPQPMVRAHRVAIGSVDHPDDLLDLFDDMGGPPATLYTATGSVSVSAQMLVTDLVVVGDHIVIPPLLEVSTDQDSEAVLFPAA